MFKHNYMSILVLEAKPVENNHIKKKAWISDVIFMWSWVSQYVPKVIKSQMCKFQATKPFSQKHMNLTCSHMCTYMTNMCSHVKFMCIFHKDLPHKIYINIYVKARLTVILSRIVWVSLAGLCVVDVWPGQMVYRVPTFATDLYPLSQCRTTLTSCSLTLTTS